MTQVLGEKVVSPSATTQVLGVKVLAHTGTETLRMLELAVGLVLVGLALVLLPRRRSSTGRHSA